MARLFGRLLGPKAGRALSQARAAEARGELAQAAALYAQAGRVDETARVTLLRGDAEADAAARLRFYTQASATAPPDSAVSSLARRKRALLVVTMAADTPMTATLRQDVLDAARDLETLGDHERAAEAYAQAGDVDGQARALARAGDVDKLDALLDAQQSHDREALSRRAAHDEFGNLLASGRRREAAALARSSGDEALRERGKLVEARRVSGSVLRVKLRGQETVIALGDEIVVGRVPSAPGPGSSVGSPAQRETGTIVVASAAVSRKHVTVARSAGQPVVRDLGSRNGTTLRGLALAGEVSVGEGVELKLGREVPLVVAPANEMPGAVSIEIGGSRYVAPLGPARLGIGRWRLQRADDSWVELVTDDDPPAFAGVLRLAPRVALLGGDNIASDRGGEPVLAVEPP